VAARPVQHDRNQFLNPEFQFNGTITQDPNAKTGGSGIADYFLATHRIHGTPSSPAFLQLRGTSTSFFIDDRVAYPSGSDAETSDCATSTTRQFSIALSDMPISICRPLFFGVINVSRPEPASHYGPRGFGRFFTMTCPSAIPT
jgi:hypothetical protein